MHPLGPDHLVSHINTEEESQLHIYMLFSAYMIYAISTILVNAHVALLQCVIDKNCMCILYYQCSFTTKMARLYDVADWLHVMPMSGLSCHMTITE